MKPADAVKLLYERCMALLDTSQQEFCQVKFILNVSNDNLMIDESCNIFSYCKETQFVCKSSKWEKCILILVNSVSNFIRLDFLLLSSTF